MENVTPDIIVEKIDEEIRVTVNDEGMPSRRWLAMMGRDLRLSIEQRQQELIRVMESIFRIQKDFLDQGVDGLKPMSLRDIAEMAGVHESTVSRVTQETHVQTPHGIYRLKFLFNPVLKNSSGEMISVQEVRVLILELVTSEDPLKPRSDQVIGNLIGIPRRTVQKWREELGILPSGKRRKEK